MRPNSLLKAISIFTIILSAFFVCTCAFSDASMREINPTRISNVTPAQAAKYGFLPCRRLSITPNIDGTLAWTSGMQGISLPDSAGNNCIRGWKGDADLSADLFTAWDDKAFYLGVAVQDDIFFGTAQDPWEQDSIQVAFDPTSSRSPNSWEKDGTEFTILRTDAGKSLVVCSHKSIDLGDRSASVSCTVARKGDKTLYDIAFPWSAIGCTPPGAKGPHFGFSMLVNDNDGTGRKGWIELTPGIGTKKDPSEYLQAMGLDSQAVCIGVGSDSGLGNQTHIPVTLAYSPAKTTPGKASFKLAYRAENGWEKESAEEITTEPGKLVIMKSDISSDDIQADKLTIECRVDEGGTVISASQVLPLVSKSRIASRINALGAKLNAVENLRKQAAGMKIATDYQDVTIATARDFIGYASEDLENGKAPRAAHVCDVLEASLTDAEKSLQSYISGKSKPQIVPRFVTGRLSVKDGNFWGDTIIPTTGKKERRPVFLEGYGHFGRIQSDIAKMPSLGCDIIQIECGPTNTLPAYGVTSDAAFRDYIGKALTEGEKNNVMVCWMTSPHYMPDWVLKKWPEIAHNGVGFSYSVDAPEARNVLREHLEIGIKAAENSPALHSIALTNEPLYPDWINDSYRKPLWHNYLKKVYGSIDKLNSVCKSSYKSFEDVPILPTFTLPAYAGMTPLRYDEARFNMDQFADFHKFLNDSAHAVNPKILTSSKVMNVPASRQNLTWGCDPEEIGAITDLNGNDAVVNFKDFGSGYASTLLKRNMWYDLQYSLRRVPIYDSENHIIADREQRLNIPAVYTDCALWQGAIHGEGASTIWLWERSNDPKSDFDGSILHRPENVMAVGVASLDLMRLAPEVCLLQKADAPVGILYSMTSQIWSDEASDALYKAYEALNFTGLPASFISEKAVVSGGLKKYKALILPDSRNVPDAVRSQVKKFKESGGQVWSLGNTSLTRDEHDKACHFTISGSGTKILPLDCNAMELRDKLVSFFPKAGIHRAITIKGQSAKNPWGIE